MELHHVQMFSFHGWVFPNMTQFISVNILLATEIPLADAGSLTTGPSADTQVSFEVNRLPKASWRICESSRCMDPISAHPTLASLARIIVYSMAPDGIPSSGSNMSTPFYTPMASGTSTPLPQINGHQVSGRGLADYLSAPLGKTAHYKTKTYIAGSKALDSLAKLIASTEGFFHPTNSGSWTSDVGPSF